MDINAIGGMTNTTQTTTIRNDRFGKNEFFGLLITQLSNQDPMNPMEDKDFITQLAQFSTLEGMNDLNTGFNELRGASLLGRTVVASRDADGEDQIEIVTGVVEGISHAGDRIMLNLGEQSVYMDNVEVVEQTISQESAAVSE